VPIHSFVGHFRSQLSSTLEYVGKLVIFAFSHQNGVG